MRVGVRTSPQPTGCIYKRFYQTRRLVVTKEPQHANHDPLEHLRNIRYLKLLLHFLYAYLTKEIS